MNSIKDGGEGGIRTLVSLRSHAFQACGIDRYPTSPSFAIIQNVPMANLEKVILPLYSHKKESDEAGKHGEWTNDGHKIAEGAAIATDIVANVFIGGYLLGVKKNPRLALAALILYHAAVNIFPDPVSKVVNSIKKKQVSQSEAKPL